MEGSRGFLRTVEGSRGFLWTVEGSRGFLWNVEGSRGFLWTVEGSRGFLWNVEGSRGFFPEHLLTCLLIGDDEQVSQLITRHAVCASLRNAPLSCCMRHPAQNPGTATPAPL